MNYSKRLDPDMDLNEYFESEEFGVLELGRLSLSSGKLIVADPLCNLEFGDIAPFSKRVPKGAFPVTVSVFAEEGYDIKYLAAKVSFNQATAVRFQLAMKPGEWLEQLQAGEIFGFPVGSGLASFCDGDTQKKYQRLCEKWKKEHPTKNMYSDFFAEKFMKNATDHPLFQHEEGDWLNFQLDDKHNVMMFNAGFGDGVYPCYFGYDERGELCQLVIQFISPAELT